MSAKYVALVILAIALALQVVSSFPHREMLDCKDKSDGVYPDPDDSRGYYVCLDHRAYVHLDCEEGEHYDDSFKTCVKDIPDADEELSQSNASDQEVEIDKVKEEVTDLLSDAEPKWPGDRPSSSKYKVYNVQVTENIFPQSVVIIGRANREQKNK